MDYAQIGHLGREGKGAMSTGEGGTPG